METQNFEVESYLRYQVRVSTRVRALNNASRAGLVGVRVEWALFMTARCR